jgi:excisionase family DNA binding protein
MAPGTVELGEPPAEAEIQQAQLTVAKFSPLALKKRKLRIATDDKPEDFVALPASAVEGLFQLLRLIAAGNAVTIIPIHAELTTQQAADLLGVSRPFLIKQIEEGKLPCRKVGTHRRVLHKDLVQYKQRADAERLRALQELSDEAQRLGLGY